MVDNGDEWSKPSKKNMFMANQVVIVVENGQDRLIKWWPNDDSNYGSEE